ncbi:hypothetical protein S40293_06606 [Stachybotrys chartarum IBT 40293]|nr:hypothetical protein S40293_06606 [Stachybotrys chartarum IBT 40293]
MASTGSACDALSLAPTDGSGSQGQVPNILPHERVFPIQIGTQLFKLSGASLSSDAPSYFSQYFLCQLKAAGAGADDHVQIRTLYIDRDPETFRDISLHLQGYHVQPRDGTHFVRLFADAQFYSLPKLISQLYEESIFISIGHREFQIPRSIFNDRGNSPNYFSLGFAAFFSNPAEIFPGLDREGLIRPPSILPPSVPNRSAKTFDDLLHLLKGYPVDIRDEAHRQELLRDARYFHFKGLEQRLVPHEISYNQLRKRSEITLRLEYVQKSGISVAQSKASGNDPSVAHVNYARPYLEDPPAELVLEIGLEDTKIHFSTGSPRAEFFRETRVRVARLFQVIATKLNLPPIAQTHTLSATPGGAASQIVSPGDTPLSENLVRVVLEPESAIVLDGRDFNYQEPTGATYLEDLSVGGGNSRKRRRADGGVLFTGDGGGGGQEQWTVRTGQWRLRIQGTRGGGKAPVECVLVAVKLDAVSSELGRNVTRSFLGRGGGLPDLVCKP